MKHHHLSRTAYCSALAGTVAAVIAAWTEDSRWLDTAGPLFVLAIILWIVTGLIWIATEDERDNARELAVAMVENAHRNLEAAKEKP